MANPTFDEIKRQLAANGEQEFDLENNLISELYDTTPEETKPPELNEGLTEEELAEVDFFKQFLIGVIIITGEPRAGKDLFMHWILWKLKLLFKGFRVLLDRKPRLMFGKYTPFDEKILIQEFSSLNEKYKTGKNSIATDFAHYSDHKEELNALINKWNMGHEGLFTFSGIGLTEWWRYFYNRAPHNPMNAALSPVLKRYGHLHCVVLGTTPHAEELDTKACLQYVTHELSVQAMGGGIHVAQLRRRRFINNESIIVATDEAPPTLVLDALKPRERLCGQGFYSLYNSWERGESKVTAKFK